MNIDFHYYGTFVAAFIAGYKFDEAKIIAHAAQYVDDSTYKRIEDNKGNRYLENQIPTCQDFTELLSAEASRESGNKIPHLRQWDEEFYNETSKIWMAFHFLPGNFDKNLKEYHGSKEEEGKISLWKYDEEAEELFKSMCLSNSILVEKMINRLVYMDDIPLEAVGLTMHVLADTWAHKYYSGIPAWFINASTNFKPEAKGATPLKDVPYYNSYNYLGHSFAGHTPDLPYAKYEFKPQWSSEKIVKDNSRDFYTAFCQMVYAMKCIKEKTPFKLDKYYDLDEYYSDIIYEILNTKKDDQCEVWKDNLLKLTGFKLEDYNPDIWIKEYKASSYSKDTHYYNFNIAASNHLEFVLKVLDENDVCIYNDDVRLAKFKIKDSQGKYISLSDEDYPTFGGEANQFEIVIANKKGLRSGCTVKIRTTEDLGDDLYLGAWKLSKELYYKTKDWDISKEKWEISQDSEKNSLIDITKPVTFRNIHFNQYLAPFKSSNGKYYLTTTKEKYLWYLE